MTIVILDQLKENLLLIILVAEFYKLQSFLPNNNGFLHKCIVLI